MNRSACLGIPLILSSAAALSLTSSAGKPDFSGTYVLDMQKMKLQKKPTVLGGEIILEHREPSFKFRRAFRIESRERLQTNGYEIMTDGREVVRKNGDVASKLTMTWEGDSLVFAEKLSSPK